jgi:hypothetical protein
MDKPVRIFISSTWLDLQPEREAVEKALHRMQEAAFAGMEYFGSRPETPKEVSLAEVDRSRVYIGIFAHRYGSGITEAEYRRARERRIPCLIYFKDDNVPVPPDHVERDPGKLARLEALKRELEARHTVSSFKSPDHLATQVVTDLHNLLAAEKPGEAPAESPSKYQVNIRDAQGVVVGDGANVTQVFGAEARPSPQTQSVPGSRDRRCADLAENMRETLDLIKGYEDQRRLADDPKIKRRAEREITELRNQLAAYEAEARELGCEEN